MMCVEINITLFKRPFDHADITKIHKENTMKMTVIRCKNKYFNVVPEESKIEEAEP